MYSFQSVLSWYNYDFASNSIHKPRHSILRRVSNSTTSTNVVVRATYFHRLNYSRTLYCSVCWAPLSSLTPPSASYARRLPVAVCPSRRPTLSKLTLCSGTQNHLQMYTKLIYTYLYMNKFFYIYVWYTQGYQWRATGDEFIFYFLFFAVFCGVIFYFILIIVFFFF